MKPIISPWLIYFASRVAYLKIFAGCILACCMVAILVVFISGDVEYSSILTYKSFMEKCLIASIVSAVVLVITPSEKTIYTMAVVNEITPNNIQAVGKTGKDIVYYITNHIDKVVNKDDEKEK